MAQLIALLGGKDFHLFFHQGMQNTHDFQQRSAQPGEFRDQQDILRLHGRKEGTEFAVGEFFGSAESFFHPRINRQLLFIRVFEDFKPLIFRRLFIG